MLQQLSVTSKAVREDFPGYCSFAYSALASCKMGTWGRLSRVRRLRTTHFFRADCRQKVYSCTSLEDAKGIQPLPQEELAHDAFPFFCAFCICDSFVCDRCLFFF